MNEKKATPVKDSEEKVTTETEPTLKDELLAICEDYLIDQTDSSVIVKINRIKDIAQTL